MELKHRDDQEYCTACDALFAVLDIGACTIDGHFTARDLLEEEGLLDGMCHEAQRVAILQFTTKAAAIAARMETEQANRTADCAEDRLIGVDGAAQMTGLSVDQLYRRKDLPFRVKAGPGSLRFSVKGIERWIRAKTLKPAA